MKLNIDSSNQEKGFNIQSFSKNITIFSIGQFIILLFGLLQTFIIPKYLSIEDFGYWQIFILYGGYVGFLHLGYLDGLLVRWSARDFSTISSEIGISFKFLIIEQLLIITLLTIVFYFILNSLSLLLGLSILLFALISNFVVYFFFFLLSIKKFKYFSLLNIIRSGFFIIFIILTIFITKLNLLLTIIFFIGSYLVLLFVLIFQYRNFLTIHNQESIFSFGKDNLNVGIYILLGNLISLVIISANRIFVSAFFQIEQFSLFAFAISITGLALFLVQAISQVFFPYISTSTNNERIKIYKLGKSLLIIFWGYSLFIFFIAMKIIPFYLPQYVPSFPIIKILFCSIVFSGIIQIFQINYFKAYNLQKQFFFICVIALIISFFLMIVTLLIIDKIYAMAIVTVICFFIWYLINEFALRNVLKIEFKETIKNICIIAMITINFLLITFINDYFLQVIIYSGIILIITYVFFLTDIQYLFKLYKNS